MSLKRKHYFLDRRKVKQAKAIDAALDLVIFRKEIVKSLEKVAGKGGVDKVL